MTFRLVQLPQFSRNPEMGRVTESTSICDLNHDEICEARQSTTYRQSRKLAIGSESAAAANHKPV
jgi:hypothetical protein